MDSKGDIRFPDAPDSVLIWDLAGHGRKGRCGVHYDPEGVQRVAGCCAGSLVAHYARPMWWHCDRGQCPEHYCLEAWARARAHKGVDRLLGSYMVHPSKGWERPMHLTYSPDPRAGYDWVFDREKFGKMLRKVYRAMCASGIRGGVVVFHPYSWKGEEKGDKKLMPPDCLDRGLEWVFRPHFHIIGYGWVSGHKNKERYAQTGDVLHVISYKSESGRRLGREDLEDILAYCLTHCGMGRGARSGKCLDALRYFGECSPRAKDGTVCLEKIVHKEAQECPVCASGSYPVHNPLYDLHDYREAVLDGQEPVPLMRSVPFGVYVSREASESVRQAVGGLTRLQVLLYVLGHGPDWGVYSACPVPSNISPGELPPPEVLDRWSSELGHVPG